MTIYIHCGAHKTASQFTRDFFRQNQDLFDANRIKVYVDKFRGQKQVLAEEIIELAEQSYQNNYQDIIISEDANIIGLMPGIFTAKRPNFFSIEAITKFSQKIAKIHQKYNTKFILCVRRQDTYLESCYKFRKFHGAKYSFATFLDKVQNINISWFDVVNMVGEHIGENNCIVTPYELLKKSQYEFISAFIRPISTIDLSKVIFPAPKNVEASELKIAVISYFKQKFPEIPNKHRKKIISMIDKYHPKNKEKISLLSDEERKNILQQYEVSNQKLFANYISFLDTDYYEYKLPEPSDLKLVS